MTLMSPIVLIRHGEAKHMVSDLTGGWTDSHLTDLGRRQARSTAAKLKGYLRGRNCAILCSDLSRARETAEIIGGELGVKPIPHGELRELNNGIAAGLTAEQAKPHFREPTRPHLDWQGYPGAETWRTFHNRVARFMNGLELNGDELVIIVAHGGTIITAINWWLGLDMETIENVTYMTSPAGITVLDTSSFEERRLRRLNDASHLVNEGLLEEEIL